VEGGQIPDMGHIHGRTFLPAFHKYFYCLLRRKTTSRETRFTASNPFERGGGHAAAQQGYYKRGKVLRRL
jgi:hypothetical protein